MYVEESKNSNASIAAIVVTFNRFTLLQECIEALRAQTRKPDEIIVVDNSSTDESGPWLDAQSDLTVIRQPNLGSAGGQQTGIRAAFQKGHDWFWCMDDDTIPEPEALERMAVTPHFSSPNTGFLCSMLLWSDRKPHLNHEIFPTSAAEWCNTVLDDHCIRVRLHTFVSVLIARRAVQAVGLPVKEFFIIVDDHEYTDRIAQRFVCWCVLDSWVIHKTRDRTVPPFTWDSDLFKESCRIRNAVAWVLQRPSSTLVGRIRFLALLWGNCVVQVLHRPSRIRLFWWYAKGFWLRYKIETV